jgi:hypothetical protein
MPRRSSPVHQPEATPGDANLDANEPWTEGQLARWAELIAEGRAAFPAALPSVQAAQLGSEVRKRRQARLLRWIAQVVAQDLSRDSGLCSGE